MKIQVKMDDVNIELERKGVLLKISGNDGVHVGDLRIGSATAEWMKGRTREGNGKKIRIDRLIDMLNSIE